MESLFISDNGRVVLPAAVRERLGLKAKSRLFIEVKDGSLVLTPADKHYAKLMQSFDQKLDKNKIGTVDEFLADRRAEHGAG